MSRDTSFRQHLTWKRVALALSVVLIFCVYFYVHTGCLPTTSLWVAAQVHSLKPNMTEAEVNQRLGFNMFIHPVNEYSGPPWANHGSGQLPFGQRIGFVWDKSVYPYRLRHLSFNRQTLF